MDIIIQHKTEYDDISYWLTPCYFICQVENLDIVAADFYCKSSITNDSCTLQTRNALSICYHMGDQCHGFTYNIGPRTATFKRGIGKPKFTLGIATVYKNEYRDALMLKETADCAPVLVRFSRKFSPAMQIFLCSLTVKTINF